MKEKWCDHTNTSAVAGREKTYSPCLMKTQFIDGSLASNYIMTTQSRKKTKNSIKSGPIKISIQNMIFLHWQWQQEEKNHIWTKQKEDTQSNVWNGCITYQLCFWMAWHHYAVRKHYGTTLSSSSIAATAMQHRVHSHPMTRKTTFGIISSVIQQQQQQQQREHNQKLPFQ